MDKKYRILVVNPGSTSTKIAAYENEEELFTRVVSHSAEQIKGFDRIYDQYEFRKEIVLETLAEEGVSL